MSKCSALWNMSGRPKSAGVIKDCIGYELKLPCITRWNSLYDSLKVLSLNKDKLPKLMMELKLPLFNINDILFLEEYLICIEPIAVALDKLQGEFGIYYGVLLPTLMFVTNNYLPPKSI